MGLRTVTDNAPTTRETADHAELTRKFEALAVDAAAARNLDGAESMMVSIQTIYDLITSRNALLSEIAALRGERDRWHSAYEIAHDQATANGSAARQAERQRDELRKALEPFAKAAGKLDGLWSEDDWRWNDSVRSGVTVRDIRRASKALANQGADQ